MVDYNLTLCRSQITMENPMPESTLNPRQVTLGIGLTDSVSGLLSHCWRTNPDRDVGKGGGDTWILNIIQGRGRFFKNMILNIKFLFDRPPPPRLQPCRHKVHSRIQTPRLKYGMDHTTETTLVLSSTDLDHHAWVDAYVWVQLGQRWANFTLKSTSPKSAKFLF